jgi:hypothetical protein
MRNALEKISEATQLTRSGIFAASGKTHSEGNAGGLIAPGKRVL